MHAQDNEMQWLIDRIARRRLYSRIMACTQAVLDQVTARQPRDRDLDPDVIAEQAYQIGLATALKFVKEGLIAEPIKPDNGGNGK